MPQMKRREDTPQTVIGRVLTILAAFGPDNPVLTLTQISVGTGLPTTTTFRLVRELVEWGALVRDAELRYQIGPTVLGLATKNTSRVA